MANNPFVNDSIYDRYRQDAAQAIPLTEVMTREGTVRKALGYFAIVLTVAVVSWVLLGASPQLAMGGMIVGLIGGLVACLWAAIKKEHAPVAAPIYAVFEGVFLGTISGVFNAMIPGVVLNATVITFGILGTMLAAYKFQWIRVTEKFRSIIIGATAAIALCYLVSMVMRMFGMKDIMFLHNTGPIGIGVSLFVIVIASMNFLLDFDNIDRGTEARLPKHFEAYLAMSVIITLVWVYIEVLRLLSKLNRN